MTRSMAVVALLLAAGCAFEPDHATAFAPPPEYRAWFTATEGCAERAGDFTAIRWFSVPGKEFACPTGMCVARWESGHRIYVAEHWIGHEMVVRHEMLHELIGKTGHPNPPFGVGCPLTWETWPAGGTTSRSGLPPAID